jgi:hypothetical protein
MQSDFRWFDIPSSSRVFDLHRPEATVDLRGGSALGRRWLGGKVRAGHAGNAATSHPFPSQIL